MRSTPSSHAARTASSARRPFESAWTSTSAGRGAAMRRSAATVTASDPSSRASIRDPVPSVSDNAASSESRRALRRCRTVSSASPIRSPGPTMPSATSTSRCGTAPAPLIRDGPRRSWATHRPRHGALPNGRPVRVLHDPGGVAPRRQHEGEGRPCDHPRGPADRLARSTAPRPAAHLPGYRRRVHPHRGPACAPFHPGQRSSTGSSPACARSDHHGCTTRGPGPAPGRTDRRPRRPGGPPPPAHAAGCGPRPRVPPAGRRRCSAPDRAGPRRDSPGTGRRCVGTAPAQSPHATAVAIRPSGVRTIRWTRPAPPQPAHRSGGAPFADPAPPQRSQTAATSTSTLRETPVRMSSSVRDTPTSTSRPRRSRRPSPKPAPPKDEPKKASMTSPIPPLKPNGSPAPRAPLLPSSPKRS